MNDLQKISIRFFDDREVRALWDEQNAKWWFSVVDVVGILNQESHYTKAGNYWRWLKRKLLKENIQFVIYNTESPKNMISVLRNLYVLGRACAETQFPIPAKFIEKAIVELAKKGFEEKSLEAFHLGLNIKSKTVNQNK